MSVSLKHNVLQSLKWVTLSKFGAQLLRWAATLLVIRLLDPADYGIVALAETVIGVIEIFLSVGLGAAIIRSPAVSPLLLRSVFSIALLFNGLLFVALFASAPLFAELYGQEDLTLALRVLGAGFVLSALELIPNSLLLKNFKYKKIAMVQFVSGLVGAGTSVVLALLGFGFWTLILGGMSIQVARVLMLYLLQPAVVWPTRNLRAGLELASFGGVLLAANLVWHVYVSMDIFIAGRFWTAEELGLYAVALQLAVMPLQKILPTLKQISLPAYSSINADRSASRYYVQKALRLSMSISLPVFFGLASITVLLVPIVLNEKWAASVPIVTLLFLTMPFRMFLELQQPAVIAAGGPGLILKNSVWILLLLTPVFYLAAQYDARVLALAWLLVFPVLALLSSYSYCSYLGVPYLQILKDMFPPLLLSVLMFVLVRGTIHWLDNYLPDWLNLLVSTAVGALFYVGMSLSFNKHVVGELKALRAK